MKLIGNFLSAIYIPAIISIVVRLRAQKTDSNPYLKVGALAQDRAKELLHKVPDPDASLADKGISCNDVQ